MSIMLPMLAITAAVGNVSIDDITLAWTLFGLPDADRLERDLRPPSGARRVGRPGRRAARPRSASSRSGFRYPQALAIQARGTCWPASTLSWPRARPPRSSASTARASPRCVAARPAARPDRRPDHRGRHRRPRPRPGPLAAHDRADAAGPGALPADRRTTTSRSARSSTPTTAPACERAARLSGFAAVVDELPLGWDTVLARELPGGAELSGGQWQRLALARALFATFHGARILVLDEPTAALDVRAEARFYERFHEITAGPDHAGDLAPVRHRPPRAAHLRARRRRDHRTRQPRRPRRGGRHVRGDVPAPGREVREMTARCLPPRTPSSPPRDPVTPPSPRRHAPSSRARPGRRGPAAVAAAPGAARVDPVLRRLPRRARLDGPGHHPARARLRRRHLLPARLPAARRRRAAGDAAQVAAGVAVVAVLLGLAWVLTGIGATEAMALSDRIAVYRTRRMIELISSVPTLEHLERPDYLAQVEQLNAGRRQLASAPTADPDQRLVGRPHHRPARAARLGLAVAAAAPGRRPCRR